MSRWDVRTLDVWGNGPEGYEVNNTFASGHVDLREMLEPVAGAAEDIVVDRLIREGHLNEQARHAELEIESPGPEIIEVNEPVMERVEATTDSGEMVYDDAEEAHDERFYRPLFNLFLQEPSEPGGPHDSSGAPYDPADTVEPFWERWVSKLPFRQAQVLLIDVELHTNPKMVRNGHLEVDVWVDGEYFGVRRIDRLGSERLGLDRFGNEVEWPEQYNAEVMVALDAYLELGEGDPRFLKADRP